MTDLTKLLLHSGHSSFHVLNRYEGSVTIPATPIDYLAYTEYEFDIPLNVEPSLLQVMFTGPNSGPQGQLSRPAGAWASPDNAWVIQGATATAEETTEINNVYKLGYYIKGSTLTIRATSDAGFYFTNTTPYGPIVVKYMIIDYVSI